MVLQNYYHSITMELKTKPRILQKLIKLQGKTTDAEFSKRLGISISLWRLTKRGYKKVYFDLLTGVLNEFPELWPEVFEYMRNNGNDTPRGRP